MVSQRAAAAEDHEGRQQRIVSLRTRLDLTELTDLEAAAGAQNAGVPAAVSAAAVLCAADRSGSGVSSSNPMANELAMVKGDRSLLVGLCEALHVGLMLPVTGPR